jgi:hypothetical protein
VGGGALEPTSTFDRLSGCSTLGEARSTAEAGRLIGALRDQPGTTDASAGWGAWSGAGGGGSVGGGSVGGCIGDVRSRGRIRGSVGAVSLPADEDLVEPLYERRAVACDKEGAVLKSGCALMCASGFGCEAGLSRRWKSDRARGSSGGERWTALVVETQAASAWPRDEAVGGALVDGDADGGA